MNNKGVGRFGAVVRGKEVFYEGVFTLSLYDLRYIDLRGGTRYVRRELFERGDSVAVLPYDPRQDKILLIQQFLVGAHVAGRPADSLHVVTGRIDSGESAEDAGCKPVKMKAGPSFLPSPGMFRTDLHILRTRRPDRKRRTSRSARRRRGDNRDRSGG